MDVTCKDNFIETNGIHLHVVTAGDPGGTPVVLLHGFPEFWYGWRHQLPALVASGYRVIVPDQRGYNLSDKPKGVQAYRMDELCLDVVGLLDHFEIGKANLVGHDWGGVVVWAAAVNHSNRLARLAILNAPHPAVMLTSLRTSLRQALKSWYIGFFQLPGLPEKALQAHHFSVLGQMLTSSANSDTFIVQELKEYKQAWAQPGALTAMLNWYRAAFRFRSDNQEQVRVHIPALILWGKRDVALSSGMAQSSIELCDDGRLIYFENATHWVQHDDAAEVNRQLVTFIDGKQ
jgi:epoxide hydrolase 4